MKIVDIKKIEDCLDGSYIREILLDNQITQNFISILKKMGGKMNYYPDFAQPFFKLVIPGKFSLKGVEGSRTMRLFLNADCAAENLIFIKNFINGKEENMVLPKDPSL